MTWCWAQMGMEMMTCAYRGQLQATLARWDSNTLQFNFSAWHST